MISIPLEQAQVGLHPHRCPRGREFDVLAIFVQAKVRARRVDDRDPMRDSAEARKWLTIGFHN